MLIDFPVYIGHDPARNNEGRVLLESLRHYLDSLREPTPNDANEVRAVAYVALTLFDAVLTHTETLETYQESDGKGRYRTVYRAVGDVDQANAKVGAGEGQTV